MTGVQAHRALIVDDERPIRRFMRVSLASYGWDSDEAESAEKALALIASGHYDTVILDLGLPDSDGKTVISRVREWSQVPIIVVSARDQEAEKIAALDAGADDYLTKPFGVGELVARLRAALRRAAPAPDEPVFRVGSLEVDFASRQVRLSGTKVPLTPIEYDLLRELCRNAGKVLTHRFLLQSVWGEGYEHESHLLQVRISALRRKIEPDPARPVRIITEPGVGYRLNVDDA